MTDKEIIEKRASVTSLLDDYQIGAALDIVKDMLKESGLIAMIPKANEIAETYKYMIHYLLEGARDDNRENLLGDLSERIHTLGDMAVRAVKRHDSSEYYYSLLRFNELRKEHLSEILQEYGKIVSELSLAEAAGNDVSEFRKQKEELLERLFNSLFTSLGEDSEYAELVNYLTSGYADNNIASQSLSAITLSLLCFYDKGKMNALLDIYENVENEAIAARALVGIVLTLVDNAARVNSDPRMKGRLYLWNDSIETYRRLRETIRIIVGTRDTERVAAKMKEEVLPELMKLRPDIMKKLNEISGTESEAVTFENNPEWEEILEKSGLSKKMQELSEMQSEGADLMMVTFSNLKNFPFFNTAANWFLPFDSEHTALSLDGNMKKFIDMLQSAAAIVCDSDMYSLALSAARMPQNQREIITGQLSAQFDQMKEEMKSQRLKSSTPTFDIEVQKVVRDLYRFFKLFRKREGFNDPFARPLNFTAMPVIGEMMQDEDVLELIGEFYFKRGYYNDALPILEHLSESRPDDGTLFEKIGFCHQYNDSLTAALDAYDKASLLKTPGPWLVQKLAYVNRRLGNYDKAADYYQKALNMDPDNLSLLMNVGNMMLMGGDNAGALRHFYHANYVSPDNKKVLRAIAWVEFLNGNFSKSGDYYSRVISMEARASDYLNAGHASLMQNKFKDAVEMYRKSAEGKTEEFRLAFMADLDTLVSLGANRKTALILLDSVIG